MMEKVKQTTLVLGEGITEFFFLDSLKDEYRGLRQVKPSCQRNSRGGCFEKAIKHALKSKEFREATDSDCSFAELGEMFNLLLGK